MMHRLRNLIIIVSIMPFCRALGQAPLPAADLGSISSVIKRDFDSIDNIRTIGMTDDPNGRFDVIVIGSRSQNNGWRVEVVSITDHKVTTKWDSDISATEPEFSNSGPKNVTVRIRDYDYVLSVEGCAPHLCHDGVSGFLMFSGRSQRAYKAKVVTRGLDKPNIGEPKYDVTFSRAIDDRSKDELEAAICKSRAISNKTGLPFSCQSF